LRGKGKPPKRFRVKIFSFSEIFPVSQTDADGMLSFFNGVFFI